MSDKIKLDKGTEYSFPALPNESCHMAINGVIVERTDACIHGEVGDAWAPVSKRTITVTSVGDKSAIVDLERRPTK